MAGVGAMVEEVFASQRCAQVDHELTQQLESEARQR